MTDTTLTSKLLSELSFRVYRVDDELGGIYVEIRDSTGYEQRTFAENADAAMAGGLYRYMNHLDKTQKENRVG